MPFVNDASAGLMHQLSAALNIASPRSDVLKLGLRLDDRDPKPRSGRP